MSGGVDLNNANVTGVCIVVGGGVLFRPVIRFW